ncbi:hypothetical protein FNV43_RR14694 [Rhamnella rubrinervis]|uniref:Cytochrome b561 domain-containing protein n=1 Tax=Rhamnella rubrinervis TaxID=2594499 RepID=A0A8K0H3F0_9ROSA|nr:hypothetical protein FNV43_RR14694 [Rhamnella rubrinervis]
MQQIQQKLVSLCIQASFLLVVFPLVGSSQEDIKSSGSQTSNKDNIHNLSNKLSFEITLHGFLSWASMGFFMPVGILTIRMSNREDCGRRLKILFYVHAISQILSVLLATAGAVISFRNFNNTFNNNHQRIGITLYGLIWLQALIGFLRPRRVKKKEHMVFCALDTWDWSVPSGSAQYIYRFTSLS